MSTEAERCCTLLFDYKCDSPPSHMDLQKRLENPKIDIKEKALEDLILLMLSGENYNRLLITVIRFIVPANNKQLKKLLNIFWELIEKTKGENNLRPEMILVINSIKLDLEHANEYVRGSTLRLLSKMRHFDVVQPLLESILQNLTHRHSYVRRNAVMCVYAVVKKFGLEVIPNSLSRIVAMLTIEGDLSTKRNAFLFLVHCQQETALQHIAENRQSLSTTGDIFQLVVVELIRRVCRTKSDAKHQLLKVVQQLMVSCQSSAVVFECASTIVTLCSSPTRIELAVVNLVKILNQEADNNVKMIVLDKLKQVFQSEEFRFILDSVVLDILRSLSCPCIEVRKRVLEISLSSLVNLENVNSVVKVLTREALKTLETESQAIAGNVQYRRCLVKALHSAATQHSTVVCSVLPQLLQFLHDSDLQVAVGMAHFLRDCVHSFPEVKPILKSVVEYLGEIKQSRVLRTLLWIVGEYLDYEVQSGIDRILQNLAPFPLSQQQTSEKEEEPEKKLVARTVILPDGTYGTQNLYQQTTESRDDVELFSSKKKTSSMRDLVVSQDFLLHSVLAVSLTKLLLRVEVDQETRNRVLYLCANLVKLAKTNPETVSRLLQCLEVLNSSQTKTAEIFLTSLEDSKPRLAEVLQHESQHNEWNIQTLTQVKHESDFGKRQPDQALVFRQLRRDTRSTEASEYEDEDLFVAKDGSHTYEDSSRFSRRLQKVKPMTGLSDPVYVEVFLEVQSFDLSIELTIFNRTAETLQNITVELYTHGEMKLVEKPPSVTLAGLQKAVVRASVKVSATETSTIFGFLSFEKKSADEKEQLVLAELNVDILDYMEHATIAESQFRQMWCEFEWENKINIQSSGEPRQFLEHVMENTKMSLVGISQRDLQELSVPDQLSRFQVINELIQTSSFIVVNLYARSIFGEDALVNVSIEREDEKLGGSIRIRSRNQGIALSLGDRITKNQLDLKK